MSLITRALPGLFGGISQQIPAMRHPTQCEDQLNMVATVSDGLYTRPGTQHVATLDPDGAYGASIASANGNVHAHTVTGANGALYDLVLANGNLMLYNTRTGQKQVVAFPDGKTYLNNSDPSTGFACITVADYTFIANRAKVPAMTSFVVPANPVGVAYINVQTAVPDISYAVTVNGTTATHSSGASPVTNMGIASALATALSTALGAGYTVSVLAQTSIIKVVKATGSVTCTAYDSWSNTTMKVVSNGVPKYEDLPPRFEQNYTVRITGTADSAKDNYYVVWDGTKWVEALAEGLPTTLDKTTMPHQLYQLGDGSWVFEAVPDWDTRRAGDDDTNPLPSFIGNPIRDVFFFRNRLGFLAGDAAILSRSGRYFSFFSRSATQVLDSDPIDLSASVDGVDYLTWAVPFNTNLLVWTNTQQQMVLTGGDVLSPNTARLLPSTSFVTDPATRPVQLGNRAVFADRSGDFAQLSLYRVSQDTVTNKADPLTDHVRRLVPASPRALAASTAWKGIVVVPSGATNELRHLKYEVDEQSEALSQKSWSRFRFETTSSLRILKAHWDNLKLYLLVHYTAPGGPAAGTYCIEVMDFERGANDAGLDHTLAADRKVSLGSGTYDAGTNRTTYTVPYYEAAGLTFLWCASGLQPYPLTPVSLTPSGSGATVVFSGDTRSRAVWACRQFTSSYTFSEVFMRDANGVPIQAASLKLVAMLVRFVNSARASAKVTPYLRGTYSYPFGGRVTGLPGHGAEQLSVSTGDFRIPVGAQAANTAVTIEAAGPLPVTLPYAEWVGDVTMKAQR